MNSFDEISDEQLASFLDGNTSEMENEQIYDAVSTEEDMEILSMAFSTRLIIEEGMEDMPKSLDISLNQISKDSFEWFGMCGFVGEEPESLD